MDASHLAFYCKSKEKQPCPKQVVHANIDNFKPSFACILKGSATTPAKPISPMNNKSFQMPIPNLRRSTATYPSTTPQIPSVGHHCWSITTTNILPLITLTRMTVPKSPRLPPINPCDIIPLPAPLKPLVHHQILSLTRFILKTSPTFTIPRLWRGFLRSTEWRVGFIWPKEGTLGILASALLSWTVPYHYMRHSTDWILWLSELWDYVRVRLGFLGRISSWQ